MYIYIYISLSLKWSDSADFWIIYGSIWVHHGLPHFPHFRPVWHFQCSQFRLPVIPNPMPYRQSDKHAQTKTAALGTLGKRNVFLYVCFVPPQHAQSKSTRNGSGTGTLATHHLAPFGVTWLVGVSPTHGCRAIYYGYGSKLSTWGTTVYFSIFLASTESTALTIQVFFGTQFWPIPILGKL